MDLKKAKIECQKCKDNWATEERCANYPVKEQCDELLKD